MQNEIDDYYNNVYKCKSDFVFNLCELLYKITKIKFYCNLNKRTILNLSIFYFEEIINNEKFIFEDYNYHDLVCSNIDNNLNLKEFLNDNFKTIINKKFIIKYDSINNKWTLLLCFIEDNFCYILVNFKLLEELITFFNNNSQLLNSYKYAIVPYINLEEYYIKKSENEFDDLINKLDNLTINKRVIKNKIKKL